MRCSLPFENIDTVSRLKIKEDVQRRECFCPKKVEAEIIKEEDKWGKLEYTFYFLFCISSIVPFDIVSKMSSAYLAVNKFESQKSIKVSPLHLSMGDKKWPVQGEFENHSARRNYNGSCPGDFAWKSWLNEHRTHQCVFLSLRKNANRTPKCRRLVSVCFWFYNSIWWGILSLIILLGNASWVAASEQIFRKNLEIIGIYLGSYTLSEIIGWGSSIGTLETKSSLQVQSPNPTAATWCCTAFLKIKLWSIDK